jgi:hypothetical protein
MSQVEELLNVAEIKFVKYVKTPGADKELALNPSAKVYREIEMIVTGSLVKLSFGTVTKSTATGSHNNGALNKYNVEMPLATFLDSTQIPDILGQEPYLVVQKVIKMSEVLHSFFGEKELPALLGDISKI